jgi:hypothetical protein
VTYNERQFLPSLKTGDTVRSKLTGDLGTVEKLGGHVLVWVRWDDGRYRAAAREDLAMAVRGQAGVP